MIATFISYSNRDLDVVRAIRVHLAEAGLQSFVDFETFGRVSNWQHRVRLEIEAHASFLAVVSVAYSASSECQMELAHARRLKKPLIAVLRDSSHRIDLADFVSVEHLNESPALAVTTAALRSLDNAATGSDLVPDAAD